MSCLHSETIERNERKRMPALAVVELAFILLGASLLFQSPLARSPRPQSNFFRPQASGSALLARPAHARRADCKAGSGGRTRLGAETVRVTWQEMLLQGNDAKLQLAVLHHKEHFGPLRVPTSGCQDASPESRNSWIALRDS